MFRERRRNSALGGPWDSRQLEAGSPASGNSAQAHKSHGFIGPSRDPNSLFEGARTILSAYLTFITLI